MGGSADAEYAAAGKRGQLYETLFRGPNCWRRVYIRPGHHRRDLSIRGNGQGLEREEQDLLYCNTDTDPEEQHNAASHPTNATIVHELRTRLIG